MLFAAFGSWLRFCKQYAAFRSWNLPFCQPFAAFGSWNLRFCKPFPAFLVAGTSHFANLQHFVTEIFHLACYLQVVVGCWLLSVMQLWVLVCFVILVAAVVVVAAVVFEVEISYSCRCNNSCLLLFLLLLLLLLWLLLVKPRSP